MQGSKLFFVYNDNHIFYILFHCYSDSLYIPRLALSSIFNLIHLLLQRCDNRSIHNTIAHHTFIHPCLLCGDTMAFKVFQLFWYLEFYTSSKLSHVVLKYSWDTHFFLFFWLILCSSCIMPSFPWSLSLLCFLPAKSFLPCQFWMLLWNPHNNFKIFTISS